MRAVTECMPDFTGNVSCTVSDGARTIAKAVSNRCACFLDTMPDGLGRLLGFVDRVDFA